MNKKSSVLLFDGICNLCNGLVRFILKQDKKNKFGFMPLQSEKGRKLLKEFSISAGIDSVILIHHKKVFVESDAAIEICRMLGFPWNIFVVGKAIPKKIRNKFYRFIAGNRYKWFGKSEYCQLFSSEK